MRDIHGGQIQLTVAYQELELPRGILEFKLVLHI